MDEEVIKRIIREERDKERIVCIEISGLDQADFIKLRKKLRKRTFKLISGILCTVGVKDDEGVDIRKKDGW